MIFSVERPVSVCRVCVDAVFMDGSVYRNECLRAFSGQRVLIYYFADGEVYVCRLHGELICVAEEVGVAEFFSNLNEMNWLMARAAGWGAYVHH